MDNYYQLTIIHQWINYLLVDKILIDILEFTQFIVIHR